MTPKQLEDYYARLAKQGKAQFKLIFKAAPGEDDFRRADPLAEVTITASHPDTGEQFHAETRQMSSTENEAEITIPILSISGVFKKVWDGLWGKPKPKPGKVVVTVHPHAKWADLYEANTFPLDVRLGTNPPVHVWLTPKDRFGGLGKPTKLSRPRADDSDDA